MAQGSGKRAGRPGLCLLLAGLLVSVAGVAQSQEMRYLRIGTGGQSGTYFPVGSLIARAISDMSRGPDCSEERCGVPGLVAVAQISNGSVANVAALQAGEIEMALVQADVAHWAYEGSEIFTAQPRHRRLRFAAHLYSEAMQIVVRRDAGVESLADLRGRPVALDEPGSGTLIHVRNLLQVHGLREADTRPVYIKPDLAQARIAAGSLDAFFIVAGWPTKAVSESLASGYGALLAIGRDRVEQLVRTNPFLTPGTIPAEAYDGSPAIPSVMVGAHLLVRADLPDAVVTALLEQMWSERGLAILRGGHLRGADIRLDSALSGRSVPLHDGARAFYAKSGLRID